MRLSEMLEPKEPKGIKTIEVKKVRELLCGGGTCYTTINEKRTYILINNEWYTPMGKKPLQYNFIIVD